MFVERILVGFLHTCKGVIHVAVTGFVSTDDFHHVSHRCGFWQLPIFQGHIGHLPIHKVWKDTGVNIMKKMCVGSHRFFFQIPYESVAYLRREYVRQEEQIEKHTLCPQDGESEERSALTDLHECQQMHPLVFSFFQERVDPSIVSFHPPETLHVA